MNSLNNVYVEISVVLGKSVLPIHQLLRMGRGAVIELDSYLDDDVLVLANNVPIAHGTLVVQGDKIAVSITSTMKSFQADAA
ncbi:MAG: FliM/FliN family flagellar motor switch protein [Parvibaculum sp.]